MKKIWQGGLLFVALILTFAIMGGVVKSMTLIMGVEVTPMVWLGLTALSIAILWAWTLLSDLRKQDQIRVERLDHFERRAEEAPEKVRYAWDLAREKLEAYFDRNLNQVRMIFFLAAVVMLAGFTFILWGLWIAINNPDRVKVALIASASGIITQFIGLTFMVIYKSTMLQATQFMSVLERINIVGMAVGILDAMKDDSGDLKDTTRVDIIRLLLATPSSHMSFTPQSPKTSPKNDGPDKPNTVTV
jgi:putative ubiquitin-RnfH superfamily antitoxin RatB of RatAB toxin-antitoxin module